MPTVNPIEERKNKAVDLIDREAPTVDPEPKSLVQAVRVVPLPGLGRKGEPTKLHDPLAPEPTIDVYEEEVDFVHGLHG